MSDAHNQTSPNSDREPQTLLGAFEKHRNALKHFIARYLNNHHDIEDVAQESFLRAYRAGMDTTVRDPKSYLFRIAKNVAVSQLRLKSRQITDYIDDKTHNEFLTENFTLEDDAIARQQLGIHCEAVASLPPQCRRVYIMRKVHGMTHREIADRLGIALKTVEKHLYKGVEGCDLYIRQRMEEPAEPTAAETVSQLHPGGKG